MNKLERIDVLDGQTRSIAGKLVFKYVSSKYVATNVVAIEFNVSGVNYSTSKLKAFAGGRTVITEEEHFVPWDDIQELEIITLGGISKERIIMHS